MPFNAHMHNTDDDYISSNKSYLLTINPNHKSMIPRCQYTPRLGFSFITIYVLNTCLKCDSVRITTEVQFNRVTFVATPVGII